MTANGIVPEESVTDSYTVQFFKDKRDAGRASREYEDEFDATVNSDTGCIIGNLFSRNFGHWTEELIKVAVMEELGFTGAYVIPELPSFAIESLELMGIPPTRIVVAKQALLLETAVFSTSINHDNIWSFKDALFFLRDIMFNAVDTSSLDRASGLGHERLWLERGMNIRNGGAVLNKAEVAQVLDRNGFASVDMASEPLRNQIRLAKQARCIAGAHGSQFVHSQFMNECSTVIECFSPAYVNPSVLGICKALNHSYFQVVSRCNAVNPYKHGRDCVVDIELLELILSKALD